MPVLQAALLRVTDVARTNIVDLRTAEAEPDNLALWVEVTGTKNGEFTYDMWFQSAAEVTEADSVHEEAGLIVVIPAASADNLRGASLDVTAAGGMVITNPNRPPAANAEVNIAGATLDSDLARRVQAVLVEQVNPAIASHGGAASLVGVEGETAYVQLSGGCQGCAMSRATLTQGIEVAIKEHVPEITRVMDVTDHANGENPYFE